MMNMLPGFEELYVQGLIEENRRLRAERNSLRRQLGKWRRKVERLQGTGKEKAEPSYQLSLPL